jgi:putative ABC transport system permease protein
MLALNRTLSVRYLRQRWPRAVLVIASIALGVATLVATQALNQSVGRAVSEAANPLTGIGDLLISSGDLGVPAELLEELRAARIPGVASLNGLVFARVVLPDLDRRGALLLGVEVSAANGIPAEKPLGIELKTTNLAAPAFGGPVYAGAELDRDLQSMGLRFRIQGGGEDVWLTRMGTVDAHGKAAALGGSFLLTDSATAARACGRPGFLSRIGVRLEPNAKLDEVRRAIEAVVKGRAVVESPQAKDNKIHDIIGGVELGLVLGGFGALVVGLFLVYNALSVSVAERRHDIGILRAVGATRSQIAGLFAGEAFVLGLIGSLLGVPLGLLLGQFSVEHVQQTLSDVFMPLAGGWVPVNALTILGALAAGVLTSLLAALVPAVQAAREEVADAVRRAPLTAGWRARFVQAATSVLIVAVGVGVKAYLANRTGLFIGLGLVMLGGLLATPLLAGAAAVLLRPLARRCLGIEGRLAADNLARSPARTGLVIAALAAGAALLIHTAGLTLSSEEEVLSWIDSTLRAELFVTYNSPLANAGGTLSMPQSYADNIRKLKGVEEVARVHFGGKDYHGHYVWLVAIDGPAYAAGNAKRGGDPVAVELFQRLASAPDDPTVIVSRNFADAYGVDTGGVVTLAGVRGPVHLRVLGVLTDYSWAKGTLFVDFPTFVREFGPTPIDLLHIFTDADAAPAVQEEILRRQDDLLQPPGAGRPETTPRTGDTSTLFVTAREELRPTIAAAIRRLYALAYAQELVVGLVAALGVVTALLISVLQRRRELGLLRAVGASQGQVLRSVLAEAALMGLIGAAIGVLYGLPLEWYAVRVVLYEETGFSFPVRVPWLAMTTVIGMSLLAAVLAGLGPAVHAMRLRIPEAIAYE